MMTNKTDTPAKRDPACQALRRFVRFLGALGQLLLLLPLLPVLWPFMAMGGVSLSQVLASPLEALMPTHPDLTEARPMSARVRVLGALAVTGLVSLALWPMVAVETVSLAEGPIPRTTMLGLFGLPLLVLAGNVLYWVGRRRAPLWMLTVAALMSLSWPLALLLRSM